MKRVHVFTTFHPNLLLKQFPDFSGSYRGMDFTFGMRIPRNTDALIVHRGTRTIISSGLPRSKVAFICGEPHEIHPYETEYLEQFGLVCGPENYALRTEYLRRNYACIWYAGINQSDQPYFRNSLDHDYFARLEPPRKDDRISVITTFKSTTPLHRMRREFVRVLKERFGDQVVIYGENHNFLADKAAGLLPHKYNIALENTRTDYAWTEKLSDPLLCWAYPIYCGSPKGTIDLPENSFAEIDIGDPVAAAVEVERIVKSRTWEASLETVGKARARLLSDLHIAELFHQVATRLLERPSETAGVPLTIVPEPFFKQGNGFRHRAYRAKIGLLLKTLPDAQNWRLRLKASPILIEMLRPFKNARHAIRRYAGRKRTSSST